MTIFHVYVDWTDEKCPRPFYVGKGNEFRIQHYVRNKKHKFIRKTLGIQRKIVFSSTNEKECFQKEIELISKYHTFYIDDLADKEIVCNFTKGGDGTTGWIPTTTQRENIAKGIKKAYEKNPELGKLISDKAKIRMSDPNFRAKISQKIKDALALMPEDKKREMHQKSAVSNRGKISPQRGSNSWRTTLNDVLVRQIKNEYNDLRKNHKKTKTVKLLCEKHNQTYNVIYKIVSNVTWKHIEVTNNDN
jgi:hypothetical protein